MNARLTGRKAVLASLLVACVAADHGQADDTVKLGVVTPRSGAYKAGIGDLYLEGTEFAVDEINAKGGVHGRKIEVIPIDSEWKPDVALKNVKKAIQEHNLKFFNCESSSEVANVLIKLMEENNALWFSSLVASAEFTGKDASRNFFRCNHNTDMVAHAVAASVAEKKYEKVFLIVQDYVFGHQARDAFCQALEQRHPTGKIVGTALHPLRHKDFAPYISQIMESGADVVVTTDYAGDLTLLLTTSHRMGCKKPFAAYYLNSAAQMKALGDDVTVGHFTSESYLMTIPTEANRAFVRRFHEKNGYYPEKQGKAYTATMFWAKAMAAADSLEVDDVIKAWEGLTYDGPAGKWTMRASDHQTLLPIWTAQVVRDNPYFEHAYLSTATALPPEVLMTPAEKTREAQVSAK